MREVVDIGRNVLLCVCVCVYVCVCRVYIPTTAKTEILHAYMKMVHIIMYHWRIAEH